MYPFLTRKIEHDILTLPRDNFVKKLPRAGFELAPIFITSLLKFNPTLTSSVYT